MRAIISRGNTQFTTETHKIAQCRLHGAVNPTLDPHYTCVLHNKQFITPAGMVLTPRASEKLTTPVYIDVNLIRLKDNSMIRPCPIMLQN